MRMDSTDANVGRITIGSIVAVITIVVVALLLANR
jgi:hypothetical protein